MRQITIFDPDYPGKLRELKHPPSEITISGPLAPEARVIAIVGSRNATDGALTFARRLAGAVAGAGAVVASGGAVGIDRAAHEGAIDARGRTWLIAPCGSDRVVPAENRSLYAAAAEAPGSSVVWPFPPRAFGARWLPFLERNGILVALSDVVVVLQAEDQSGARNTASWARKLGRPLWAVPVAPWDPSAETHPGCAFEIEDGARPLTSIRAFLDALNLPCPARPPPVSAPLSAPVSSPVCPPRHPAPSRCPTRPLSAPLSAIEAHVLGALSTEPRHADEIVCTTGLNAQAVATALLTLALEDVVVEGPGGFFRRTVA